MPDIPFEAFPTDNSNFHKLLTIQKLSKTNTVGIEQNIDVIIQQFRLKLVKEEHLFSERGDNLITR